jgi:hypothetical protein
VAEDRGLCGGREVLHHSRPPETWEHDSVVRWFSQQWESPTGAERTLCKGASSNGNVRGQKAGPAEADEEEEEEGLDKWAQS